MTGVARLAADVARGATSAEQVASNCLTRVEAYAGIQPAVWISRMARDQVLARARDVDRAVASGQHLPLAGVPFAIKDNFDYAGMPTTAACPAFQYSPSGTAGVVARLEQAGAVLIGKTNLDQFATGLVGTRSPYGIPACVFNREYISGGSSSGSAVAVAAGLVAFALGTDTAGSGRVPAAFNGLVGFKPTRGSWSTRGMVPACRSLDCATVFTNDVQDAARIDAVCRAFDAGDPYSRDAPAYRRRFGRQLRLAVPRDGALKFFGDPESGDLFAAAVETLRASGATIVHVAMDAFEETAQLLYGGAWAAERLEAAGDLLARNASAVHPIVRSIIQAARGVSGLDAFLGQHRLAALQRLTAPVWECADLMLLPTAPTIYRIAEVLAEPVTLNSNLGIYTNFVNLLDLAGIALPAGFRRNGTGFGVSLIGPAWCDRDLLSVGARIERLLWAERPPIDKSPPPKRVRLAVVGAHLAGMPLHWQLASRQATLVERTRTASCYRLYAMQSGPPHRPALVFGDGAAIEVEVYELDLEGFGAFVADVPPPLAIGTIRLADGSQVKGFVAEPRAIVGAEDITEFGGWRNFIAQRG